MATAFKRIGYGRLNTEETLSEVGQTGYGTKMAYSPETITGERPNVPPLKEKKKMATTAKTKLTSKQERYLAQEAKRAPKVQVDQRVVLLAWIIAIGVAFISSAIVSFNGITAVAQFVGLSADWMAGLFFFFIELMYLIFLVAYLVLASRVDENGNPEKVWGSFVGMVAFGGIAVLANAFHTLDYWQWDVTNPQVWAGVVLSIAAPVAIISASKLASRVVFAKAISE